MFETQMSRVSDATDGCEWFHLMDLVVQVNFDPYSTDKHVIISLCLRTESLCHFFVYLVFLARISAFAD
jgi:hypothetical protein